MSEIKPGDLVMVVRPSYCCNNPIDIGKTGIVSAAPAWADSVTCCFCGSTESVNKFLDLQGEGHRISTLKKIDPPAEGDSLPTRADLEVPA